MTVLSSKLLEAPSNLFGPQKAIFTQAEGSLKLDFGNEKAPMILHPILSGFDSDNILFAPCQPVRASIACNRTPGMLQ